MPELKPATGVEYISLEDMLGKLDTDGDGVIDLEEWLHNLEKLPGLRMSILQAMDPETGKLPVVSAAAAGAPSASVEAEAPAPPAE